MQSQFCMCLADGWLLTAARLLLKQSGGASGICRAVRQLTEPVCGTTFPLLEGRWAAHLRLGAVAAEVDLGGAARRGQHTAGGPVRQVVAHLHDSQLVMMQLQSTTVSHHAERRQHTAGRTVDSQRAKS